MIGTRFVGIVTALFFTAFLAQSISQTEPKQRVEWMEYEYASAGFAITLPHDPSPHNDPTMPEMTAYTVHFSPQAALTLRVSSQTRDCAVTLKQLKDGALNGKQPGLIAKSLQDVSVGGYSGVEWEFMTQPGIRQFERYVCAKGKFYYFAASWTTGEQRPQTVSRALNSFRLLNPVQH